MSLLFSDFKIVDLKLKNRIVMPPMCMYKAGCDGKMTDFHHTHYAVRAIGGVGLIIVEATAVEPRGRITDNDLGLWEDTQIDGHRRLNELCHGFGAKTAVQIGHAGRKSICKDSTPIAPSAIKFADGGGFKVPSEITANEIISLKKHFVDAAKRAEIADYDAVELHAAHGYILTEFLSPLTNKRDDEYGGSLENRCRIVVEISQAIKNETSLPLIVRVSADEWMDGGWNLEDTIFLSKKLQAVGVDIMDISAGGNHAVQQKIPPIVPLYQAGYAKQIKDEVELPVISVGLITTAGEGEGLLSSGVCDLVAYGRELLRNPNFAQYAAKQMGKKELIEPSYVRAF
jgi:NADPH2 dehydrogenase